MTAPVTLRVGDRVRVSDLEYSPMTGMVRDRYLDLDLLQILYLVVETHPKACKPQPFAGWFVRSQLRKLPRRGEG